MVPEVSLTTLMDSVLPTVPSNQINEVCEKLIANGRIETPNEKPKWECLPEDPKAAGRVKQEPKTFQFFEKIAQAIEESCSNTTESRPKLKVTGLTIPFSCRCNTSRPDGYFLMDTVNPPSTDKWSDISVPMEFENGDKEKDKIDNYAKVMWSMQHAMRGDPRRRYMHGFTCENTKARLWYNDRCDVVASEEFDINEDWRYLVRIILSILLATDAELGYDPSVVTHSPDNPGSEPVYDITIYNSNTKDPTVYRTIEIISDVGADSMVGRGTRVWSAQKVENGEPVGSVYVLKSIWVHQDRLTEHVVLEDIRAQQPTYSKYFLTPVDHGFAPLDPSDASIIFDTHSPLGRQRYLELTGKVLKTCPPPGWTPGIKTPSTSRNSVGRPGGIPNAPEEGFRDFRQLSNDPRQNYLIVFKERGKPVHELDKFTDVYTAIEGGWKGLHAVHICGYVHRDVSSGNILLLPPSDGHDTRGALMDLEYNKKVKDMTAPYDVRVRHSWPRR
ncbi:unnamed protein product [Rhizoctonia solani]|uniref:Fungal-type protein kinase domain-containing protein n=1 Tax=Rhizoctonia solani TaxID=456999 RepID=A0A8H3DJ31_9AGAM|nr:unnamed protein product [Rhizoctonia solani]